MLIAPQYVLLCPGCSCYRLVEAGCKANKFVPNLCLRFPLWRVHISLMSWLFDYTTAFTSSSITLTPLFILILPQKSRFIDFIHNFAPLAFNPLFRSSLSLNYFLIIDYQGNVARKRIWCSRSGWKRDFAFSFAIRRYLRWMVEWCLVETIC